MGDPRKIKSKYSGPMHPWNKERIKEERTLINEYGLKNKKEIWKASSKLKNFADQTKKLIIATGKQAELEKTQLINRLNRLGLIQKTAQTEDILSLTVRDILDRRLQTIIHKKGHTRTIKQARQFITHGHIRIGEKPIQSPAHIVTIEQEPQIQFAEKSTLNNPEHPERRIEKTKTAEPPKKTPNKTKQKPKKKTDKK